MAGPLKPDNPHHWERLEREAEARGRYDERQKTRRVVQGLAAEIATGRHADSSPLKLLRILWKRLRLGR